MAPSIQMIEATVQKVAEILQFYWHKADLGPANKILESYQGREEELAVSCRELLGKIASRYVGEEQVKEAIVNAVKEPVIAKLQGIVRDVEEKSGEKYIPGPCQNGDPLQQLREETDGYIRYLFDYYLKEGSFFDNSIKQILNSPPMCYFSKLDDEGNLLWLKPCPATVKRTCAAVGQDGTAYLAALKNGCRLVVYTQKDTENELKPGEEFANDASELALYDALAEGNLLWLVGSRNSMNDERFAVWHCDLATEAKKITALPTGKISCRSAATAICPDGQGGFYLAGFAEKDRAGLLVVAFDHQGQMGSPHIHEAAYDRIPMAIMRHGPFLYLCGAKKIAAGAYGATLWKYTISDLTRPPVEIDLPHIRYLHIERREEVPTLSFSMVPWEDHIIVGYHDSSGSSQCALAMVSPSDRVVGEQFDGYPNYHEHVVGLYASQRRKQVLAINQINRRWSDRIAIGITAWDVKPR